MRTALLWVITQRVVAVSYRRFDTTYRSCPVGSIIQKKTCRPITEFIYGGVLEVGSFSSVMSANRVDASGWDGAWWSVLKPYI